MMLQLQNTLLNLECVARGGLIQCCLSQTKVFNEPLRDLALGRHDDGLFVILLA